MQMVRCSNLGRYRPQKQVVTLPLFNAQRSVPCPSRWGVLKNPHCSIAMSAKHWSIFLQPISFNVIYRTQKRVKCFLEEQKQQTNKQNQQIDFPTPKLPTGWINRMKNKKKQHNSSLSYLAVLILLSSVHKVLICTNSAKL